jgi:hypothetical protein
LSDFVARGFHPMVCAAQCKFARLNFPTFASSSRRREIFDSRAKYTFMRARLPRHSDRQSQLRKMPALLT